MAGSVRPAEAYPVSRGGRVVVDQSGVRIRSAGVLDALP